MGLRYSAEEIRTWRGYIWYISLLSSARGSLFSWGQAARHLNLGDSKVSVQFGSLRLALVDSALALGTLSLNAH